MLMIQPGNLKISWTVPGGIVEPTQLLDLLIEVSTSQTGCRPFERLRSSLV